MNKASHVLTLSCVDRPGIVALIASAIANAGGNIEEASQFSDPETGQFFMRVAISVATDGTEQLSSSFKAIAEQLQMSWRLHDTQQLARVVIMVSKFDHCLNDLLYRHSIRALKMDVVAVVSNHKDAYRLAATHQIPFVHLAVTAQNKIVQEQKLISLVEEDRVDLVILARYMQILSNQLASRLAGRVINIHHSFLPSFKGAKPYHQAYARGVKLIGATAHYVTAELDEGPIIEQDVVRVSHAMGPEDLVAAGRDVESNVLARAVRFHLEHRVLPNARKTVVFR